MRIFSKHKVPLNYDAVQKKIETLILLKTFNQMYFQEIEKLFIRTFIVANSFQQYFANIYLSHNFIMQRALAFNYYQHFFYLVNLNFNLFLVIYPFYEPGTKSEE